MGTEKANATRKPAAELRGGGKPPILFGDINGDQQKEAITFFQKEKNDDEIMVLILSLKEKKLFSFNKEHEFTSRTISVTGKELDHASLAQWEKEYNYSHLVIGVVTSTEKTVYVLDLSQGKKKELLSGVIKRWLSMIWIGMNRVTCVVCLKERAKNRFTVKKPYKP